MKTRLLFALLICCVADSAAPEETVIRGVDQAELRRETDLAGYTVTEHYSIRNYRFSSAAEMMVATVYKKGEGKTYKVLSRSGSAMLQSSVFDRMLQEEKTMSRGDTRRQALVTSANYAMKLTGEETLSGRPCEVLELTPRKKSAHLLKGRAWVDSKDYSLVKIEGRPTASASFFVGRPLVTREYESVDGFSLARRSHAVSDGLFLGKTELTIEYNDYHVTTESAN
jgi:hypothetical protein